MSTSPESMKLHSPSLGESLDVPESLTRQLRRFRDLVWTTKIAEATLVGIVGVLLAYLTVYVCDRFFDTPTQVRWSLFIASLGLWCVVPRALYRWVWKHRQLEQLARLLRVSEPSVGDQLLGVIEIAHNESEQARSRTLCAAAISQVAEVAKTRDFGQAAPPTFLKSLSLAMGAFLLTSLALLLVFPDAAKNAWARFSLPWRDTPRYTFTAIDPISPSLVIPHGETTTLAVRLSEQTKWRPESGRLLLNNLPAIEAKLESDAYRFTLPPLTEPVALELKVGDYSQTVAMIPKLRPELVGSIAKVTLPDYLQRPEPYEQDVRSGSLSAVEGSSAAVVAETSRELLKATVNSEPVAVKDASFATPDVRFEQKSQQFELWWRDRDHLDPLQPFKLTLTPTVDEPPSILSQDLPRQSVVLESEQINFQALASDDFGVKRIGVSWKGLDDRLVNQLAEGEKVLSSGGPEQSSMQVPATFTATALGIPPQPVEVRLWAEDYLPGRPRVYGPPHVMFILNADEHAVWIMSQMSKWQRAALDVRDREMQLHEANKRLRGMTAEELADDEMRKELRRQAAAESDNARRLSGLMGIGENLLRQASRNPEIGVGHLDRWAEMLQILNDIGNNRMPSVADLLDGASSETKLARTDSKADPRPSVGQSRNSSSGPANAEPKETPNAKAPALPSIVDSESSLQPVEGEATPSAPKKKGGSRLGLPQTTLAGPPRKPDGEPTPESTEEEATIDKAIDEQADLLAEFQRVAEEMNTVLANLEGSTLVKRLKAASREQNQVAEKIASRIDAVFGASKKISTDDAEMLEQLASVEKNSRQTISYIMDDLHSYFERRRMNQFKVVLDEMKESQVLEAIETLGEKIPKQQGMSIAQAEYWADTLDRWGEDLVDPACSGQCPGCKTSDALPPSLILEALRILESEVNLREQTRVAEQARPAIESEVHEKESTRLESIQTELQNRTDTLIGDIEALPDGQSRFAKEIQLLTAVTVAMGDAAAQLATGDTGNRAIAAETEAIELLLKCKRINPNAGGGGGGGDPGGGGTGTTQDSALALLGSGLNQNERRESREVTQVTGESGRVFPEEFRAGLDEYFNRLEQGR